MTTHTPPTAAQAVARLHGLQERLDAIPSLRVYRAEGHSFKVFGPSDAETDGLCETITCKCGEDGTLWYFSEDSGPLISAADIPRAALFILKRLQR